MAQQIQTFIFSKENWTAERARAWLSNHDARSDKMDETENSFRFRQFDPSQCEEGSFQTLTENFPAGLSAVSCERRGSESLPLIVSMPPPEILALMESRISDADVGAGRRALRVRKGYDAEVEKDSSDNGRLRFVISTERVDRVGDVIEVAGWELDNYRRNPVVLFDHQYGEVAGSPPSQGRTIEIGPIRRRGERVLQATVEFHRATRFNAELHAMYRDGYMHATSVGFWPTSVPEPMKAESGEISGLRFKKQDLLEWSLVAVPANPEAVGLALSRGIIRPRTAEYLEVLSGRTPRGAEEEQRKAETGARIMSLWGRMEASRMTQEVTRWNRI